MLALARQQMKNDLLCLMLGKLLTYHHTISSGGFSSMPRKMSKIFHLLSSVLFHYLRVFMEPLFWNNWPMALLSDILIGVGKSLTLHLANCMLIGFQLWWPKLIILNACAFRMSTWWRQWYMTGFMCFSPKVQQLWIMSENRGIVFIVSGNGSVFW